MKNQNTLVWIIVIIALILLFLFFFGNQRSRFEKTSEHEDEIENDTEEFGGTITHHLRIPRFRQPRLRIPRWRQPRWRRPRFPVLPPSSGYHFPSEGKCEQDCRHFPTGYSRWGVPSVYQFGCRTKADGRPSRGCKHELNEPGSTDYDCERRRAVTGQLCMDKID